MRHAQVLLVVVVGLASGCVADRAGPQLQPPLESKTPGDAPSGGGRTIPSLVQLSVPSGSTDIATSPNIEYSLEGVDATTHQAVLLAVAQAVSFVDSTGGTVGAVVSVKPVGQDRVDPVKGTVSADWKGEILTVAPQTSLPQDAWIKLHFSPSTVFLVKTPSAMNGQIDVDFFTGSAPRIRYMLRTGISKGASQYVQVILSEAVDLSDLDASGFGWYAGGAKVAGCIFREGACIGPTTRLRTVGFDYQFSGAITQFPTSTSLVLAGGVRGRARSFGEAALLFGDAALLDKNGNVTYQIKESDWTVCAGDAAALCWTPKRAHLTP